MKCFFLGYPSLKRSFQFRLSGTSLPIKTMNKRKRLLAAKVLWSLSVAMYGLSFFLPSLEGDQELISGYGAFCCSFMIAFKSMIIDTSIHYFFAWFANPLYWFGVERFLMCRSKSACIAGVLATSLSATVFIGDLRRLDLLLIGYYVWFVSIGMLTVAAALRWVSEATRPLYGNARLNPVRVTRKKA